MSQASTFDALLSRNVPHILENIFFSLDYKSFKTCMQVNKTWRELLSTASYQKRLYEILIEKQVNEAELFRASKEGSVEDVKKLVFNNMVDVNVQLCQETPLIAAAGRGHPEVVKILLDGGANTNKTNRLGRTPLCIIREKLNHIEPNLNGKHNLEWWMVRYNRLQMARYNRLKEIQVLLEGSAKLD